jgi:hypothetical protein
VLLRGRGTVDELILGALGSAQLLWLLDHERVVEISQQRPLHGLARLQEADSEPKRETTECVDDGDADERELDGRADGRER